MDPADETARAALLDELRRTLQSALDALSLELAPLQKGPLLPNPFWR
jgi:hypothetical protein